MRVVVAVALAVLALGCSRRDKEKPSAAGLERAAAHADASAPSVELEFSDAGSVSGLWVTPSVDAEGIHLGLALLDGGGRGLAADRAVVACTGAVTAGTRVRVPADEPDDDARASLTAARAVRVTSSRNAGGCLRPTLRLEALARPAAE